jgi:transposase
MRRSLKPRQASSITSFASTKSHVKKTTLYAERDEEKRAAFLAEIEGVDPRKIVYIDESGVDDTVFPQYARAPRGEQVIVDINDKKSQRISLIAGLLGHKLIAPMAFEGYTDTTIFNQWIEQCLLPELPPNHVVIIDNASFHKSQKTRELIENAGCKLVFLPPYSPDFNPIEEWWAVLKSKIRRLMPNCERLIEAIEQAFQNMNHHKISHEAN